MVSRKRKHLDHKPQNKGILALLDFPPKTNIGVDGVHRILQRDDFVGISHIPENQFHLIITRKPEGGENMDKSNGSISPAMGLILFHSCPTDTTMEMNSTLNSVDTRSIKDGHDDKWIIARRYDAQTEEISSNKDSVDSITCTNLMNAVDSNLIQANRIVPYHVFMNGGGRGSVGQTNDVDDVLNQWDELSCYINTSVLQMRNLHHGDKVVPGCYETEDDIEMKKEVINVKASKKDGEIDGIEIKYPPIPCISKNSKENRLFFRTQHIGTTNYLELLSPAQRTFLYMNLNSPGEDANEHDNYVLHQILSRYYNDKWQWLLGDFQLSFLLFLHLGCLSSLTHWRDLFSMLSLEQFAPIAKSSTTSTNQDQMIPKRMNQTIPNLYSALLEVIVVQIQSMDKDFFEETEYSQGNFFIPALEGLYYICSYSWFCRMKDIPIKLKGLVTLVRQRFKIDITKTNGNDTKWQEENDQDAEQMDDFVHGSEDHDVTYDNTLDVNKFYQQTMHINNRSAKGTPKSNSVQYLNMQELILDESTDNDDDGEEDGPVIVPLEEVNASIARLSEEGTNTSKLQSYHLNSSTSMTCYSPLIRQSYPLLFAAMAPQEDILMTCARILDDKVDVSLVREAAAYLENVESDVKVM